MFVKSHLREDLGGFEASGSDAPGPAAAVAQLLPHKVHGSLGRQDVPDAVAAEQQKLVLAAPVEIRKTKKEQCERETM